MKYLFTASFIISGYFGSALDLNWTLPPQRAKEKAYKENKPILYVSFVQRSGQSKHKGLAKDIHFAINRAPEIERDYVNETFIPTYTLDVNDAKELDVRIAPAVIATDPFGNIILKEESITSWVQIRDAAKKADLKYIDKTPRWITRPVDEVIKEKLPADEYEVCKELIIYVFGAKDGENTKETVDLLSNRILVRLHKRILFVVKPFVEDGDEEDKWKTKDEGTFFVVKIDKDEEEHYDVIKKFKKPPFAPALCQFLDREFEKIDTEQERLDRKRR